jgi:hypothetical protein
MSAALRAASGAVMVSRISVASSYRSTVRNGQKACSLWTMSRTRSLGRPGIAGQRPVVLSARVIFLLYREIYVAKRSAKRREWTTQDVRELRKLAKHKTPTAKIARALKRTEGATRQKAFSLGVSLDTRT